MAEAARDRGYEYIGITDHSQSLKIAGGVSVDDLWQQIRYIDQLNGKLRGFRILKSSEVDILADGSLDYPNDLLKELDYTVCSIHSRFALDKKAQTERLLRAMDNRYFNILGHATGRLLLKRPGYEIDIGRVIGQAQQNGCFFEINSSPDRLDLSAENARKAIAAGVMIAISVNRDGIVCAVVFTGPNRGAEWPGSRLISAEKANTANAFSTDNFALSSGNVYSAAQPGNSLYSIVSGPDPNSAFAGDPQKFGQPDDPLVRKAVGGVIVFGGGLALYDKSGRIVGGLGVSGDASCADHMGVAPGPSDNLIFDIQNGVSSSGFEHPACKGGNPSEEIINKLNQTHPNGPHR
jgi:histidinol phosphatase-like PHP family hydrolase